MIPDFIPISSTKVDWDAFLTGCEKALGRNVAASLDAKSLPASGAPSFIPACREFKKPGSDAIKAFRESSGISHHVSVGFLVVCDSDTHKDLPTGHVSITSTEGVGCIATIMTGSIYNWYFFLLSALSETCSKNTRIFGMKLMLWFDRNNYGEAWGNYKRTRIDDGTYILEAK